MLNVRDAVWRSLCSMTNIILALACIGLGVRFTTTHPEVIYVLGPLHLTWYHVLFAAGGLLFLRGVWKWVTD